MTDIWQRIPGTDLFTRNGKGLYERLKPDLYLRLDELDEADEIEGCQHLAEQADAALSRHLA